MSRAGDHDRGGQGGTVASIADAPSRRRHASWSAEPPLSASMTPELDAGINLLDNCNLSAEDLGEPGTADDILDRHAESANATRGEITATHTAVDADTALADAQRGRAKVDDECDDIHEQLEHHHERGHASRAPTAPRGSADLVPSPPAARRLRRDRRSPRSSPRGLRRSRVGLAVAGVVSGVALLAGALLGPTSGRDAPTPAAMHHVISDQSSSSDVIWHSIAPAAAALAADAQRAAQRAQAHARARVRAKAAARAKAMRRARAKARSASRSRAAKARQATTHPAGVTSASTPSAASRLTTAPASPSAETPSTSSSLTTGSTPSSSTTSGSGGSTAAPAGPTGIGSAGSNCNPQCS